ncbi:DC-STAMP domain-containing protein 2 [Mixophyes fleayi]|uniref:DC-STAMP domain-containing protein 2 n=1 Tax=Mixophyes fleayi TaxID=3061075 RepID=UPI003F4DA2F3
MDFSSILQQAAPTTGTTEGPWEWMCSWCRITCSCCENVWSWLPDLCPQDPDRLKVEEVTAADYIDEKKKEVEPRIREDTLTKATLRSFGGFVTGLLLTSIYALLVLFVKNYNLWYCIVSTVTLGLFLSIGMAFSVRVRTTVFLMLPQMFSGEGKTIVLLLAFTLTLQGPVANTVENFRRSSNSLSCGVELAINETRALAEKIKRPLMKAVNTLKNIGRKLRNATDHSRKFFRSLMDGMKHVERTLRNVWDFITSMGDVCNQELEAPYIKCTKVFDEGKENCFKVMSFMGFLCHIVDLFRPLCGVTRIVKLFCIIPHYLQAYAKQHIKNPMVRALRNFRDQFDFNLTVIHKFGMSVNASKTFMQVATGIMEEVQESINPYLEMASMFSYSIMFVCIYNYIMALRYRQKYLFEDDFDNIYITRKFIELDVMRAKSNRKTLLPLSSKEAYRFVRPGSLSLTRREMKGYMFEIINVFRNLLIVTFLVLVDYIFYWVLDMVAYLLKGEVVARAPLLLTVSVKGKGFMSEMFSEIVSAFDVMQRSNITVVSKKCMINPSQPYFMGYLLIGAMYGLAFFIAICGIYMGRLKHGICAYYYPSREQERICFLYNNLLTKRLYIENALFNTIKMNSEDGGGHSSVLLVLAAKCPGFRHFAAFMGATQQYCMGCAKTWTSSESGDFQRCITSNCKGTGLYCRDCFQILNQACTICMAPLVYGEDEDEEMYVIV